MIKIELQRKNGDFGMEAHDAYGHKITMDTSDDSGGLNFGVRPMQMLLMGLGGCSAIDIVMILKKQRQQVDDFAITITSEREKGKEPSLWDTIHVVFTLTGTIDFDKAQRACDLSMNKYCSVAATLLKSGTHLSWEVQVKQPG